MIDGGSLMKSSLCRIDPLPLGVLSSMWSGMGSCSCLEPEILGKETRQRDRKTEDRRS